MFERAASLITPLAILRSKGWTDGKAHGFSIVTAPREPIFSVFRMSRSEPDGTPIYMLQSFWENGGVPPFPPGSGSIRRLPMQNWSMADA